MLCVKILILSLESTDIHMIHTKGEVDREKDSREEREGTVKKELPRPSWETFSVFVEKNDRQTACKKQAVALTTLSCVVATRLRCKSIVHWIVKFLINASHFFGGPDALAPTCVPSLFAEMWWSHCISLQ